MELNKNARTFLKRYYDTNTRTWAFGDGSGRLPDEARIELKIDSTLGNLFYIKEKYEQPKQ